MQKPDAKKPLSLGPGGKGAAGESSANLTRPKLSGLVRLSQLHAPVSTPLREFYTTIDFDQAISATQPTKQPQAPARTR